LSKSIETEINPNFPLLLLFLLLLFLLLFLFFLLLSEGWIVREGGRRRGK